jgi:hypothetical protein
MSAEDVTESSSSETSSSPVSEATSSPAVTPSESSGTPAKETMLDAVLKVIPANTEKDS